MQGKEAASIEKMQAFRTWRRQKEEGMYIFELIIFHKNYKFLITEKYLSSAICFVSDLKV